MNVSIGPYSRSRVILCSADAGPKSQRDIACEAGYFFPGAKWVATVRNAADDLRCRFVILTAVHGMVNPDDVISPYDMIINDNKVEVSRNLSNTIPRLIGGNQYDILVFHSGGCPTDPIIKVVKPILHSNKISLITFGRPNMYDIGKIRDLVDLLIKGTSLGELGSVLKYPDWLKFFPIIGC